MQEFFSKLFTSDFMPHGHCYFWTPAVVWLNVTSDALITLSYYSIPLTLLYFVRKRRDVPYRWMFLMFGGFIVACGTTHLMEVWTVWHGTYRLSGCIKALTALLSISTALALVKVVPAALTLRSPAELANLNTILEREIAERTRAENELRRSGEELEMRVQQRTQELEQVNLALKSEIAERKRAEAAVTDSLHEKETLLKEIHHRVKNNLQLISSLLQLQSGYIKDPAALQIFRDGQNRIRSMALIHEKLYQARSLAQIDFSEYVRSLTSLLIRTYHTSAQNVRLDLHIQPVSLNLETAIPFGLLLNELISNCLEHAFPDQRAGVIQVALAQTADGQVTLTVEDNGVGLPENFDWENNPSLGLRLIRILADQLHGQVMVHRQHGTAIILTAYELKTKERN